MLLSVQPVVKHPMQCEFHKCLLIYFSQRYSEIHWEQYQQLLYCVEALCSSPGHEGYTALKLQPPFFKQRISTYFSTLAILDCCCIQF